MISSQVIEEEEVAMLMAEKAQLGTPEEQSPSNIMIGFSD